MEFSLEQRTITLNVGEFAGFALGPHEAVGGPHGLWRAQLGQHWHNELRSRAGTESPDARFEVPVEGRLVHRGWTFLLHGRIDQIVGAALREIKTVTRDLPAGEEALRTDYPEYFRQLAVYLTLLRPSDRTLRGELVFVEAGSGVVQTVALTPFDEALVHHQLDALVEFLDQRLRAAERRRRLRFRPPFATLRPGQETIQRDLADAFARAKIVLFEAPTGYGKTGSVLEHALGRIRAGGCDRLIWLTGKATGQLHVMETLRRMAATEDGRTDGAEHPPLPAWQVRPKAEHCINHTFHCLRDTCEFLHGCGERWPQSGLARFYLDDRQPRDLPILQAAGREARICPYEITRASLAFNDAWIGDFNYVFAPDNRGIFLGQPGYDPARTLLVVDEAHNLPARVADAWSHGVTAADTRATLEALHTIRPPAALLLAWENWARLLARLPAGERLDPADEADVRDALAGLAERVATLPVDHAALGPAHSERLWQIPALREWLENESLSRLLWSPRAGELSFTCLDAAPAIGEVLRGFGGVLLMSGTIGPADAFGLACGLDRPPEPPEAATLAPPEGDRLGALNKRETRKLYRQLASGAELLRVEESRTSWLPAVVRAATPWRDGAYDVAVDLRVDTSFKQRHRHYGTTAETIAALHRSARADRAAGRSAEATACVAVFFPSYAYAETVRRAAEQTGDFLRIALQPRLPDLAAQTAWIEENLALSDALFLVLGSSFAEGIDLLGGRVTHAMVVGPALPEVNAVQKARLEACADLGRDSAFRRVYQIPGLQKVNQALGRLVRAPGHRAKVLLHCRRFAEPSYASLLAPEYQFGRDLAVTDDLSAWLQPASD